MKMRSAKRIIAVARWAVTLGPELPRRTVSWPSHAWNDDGDGARLDRGSPTGRVVDEGEHGQGDHEDADEERDVRWIPRARR
jgi:hypothetical protein